MNEKMKDILETMHYNGIRTGLVDYLKYIKETYDEVKDSLPGSPHDPVQNPSEVLDFSSDLSRYKDDNTLGLFSWIIFSDYWGGRMDYPYISILEDGVVHLDIDETNKSLPFTIKKAIMEITKPETLRKVYIKALNSPFTDVDIDMGSSSKYETRLRSRGTINETITISKDKLEGTQNQPMFEDGCIVNKMDLHIGHEISLNTLIELKEKGLAEQLIDDPDSNLLTELGMDMTRQEILQIYFDVLSEYTEEKEYEGKLYKLITYKEEIRAFDKDWNMPDQKVLKHLLEEK